MPHHLDEVRDAFHAKRHLFPDRLRSRIGFGIRAMDWFVTARKVVVDDAADGDDNGRLVHAHVVSVGDRKSVV